jgi:hypothetical protein
VSITEGTQPAAKQWTGAWTTAQTTASFTPESGALLVALVSGDGTGGATATTAAITDSLSGTWTLLKRQNTTTGTIGGTAEVWCRDSPGTSMTVSATGSGAPAPGGQLVVRTLIGALAAASQNGAVNGATLTAAAVQVSVAAGTGNKIYGAAFNFTNSTAMTALGNTSVISAFADTTNGDDWEAFKSSADTAGTATYGYSTADDGMIAAVEIKASAAAAAVSYVPQRYGQAAPPSFAPWTQRDRRDANTTGTPANPLPSPLDSAWQADGAYSHLYADSHLRDRRSYFYQRPYVSQPELLAGPATLDPTQAAWASLQVAYEAPAMCAPRTWQPQQRARVSDPLLLTTAELENELLGGGDTARHQMPAAYTDRREVPQQRAYISDPSFYPVQVQVGAGTTEQWWGADSDAFYRAQRILVSDPSLLTPAGPLDPTTGGQDDLGRRWRQAATHYDRREVPQQRPCISDPSFYPAIAPADPLTVAWGAGGNYWHLYNRAADITDRREYFTQRLYQSDPLLLATALLENELLGGAETFKHALWWRPGSWPQQRAYISDPSFYPSGAVTDPLTVAWGAGGNYWHLYNRAADAADRREVPQQRNYVSDPLLLSSALLENELLGGAGTAQRYGSAAYYDRREVPQQRGPVALVTPPVPFDPLLAAWADLARRYALAATHADRRLYPQQRLYFPVPLPPPPFTIGLLTAADSPLAVLTAVTDAGGSGGVLTATDQRTGGPG